jgi:hypothetical protein
MPVQDGPLNRRRLHQILRHMSRPKIWAAGFRTKFGLHIDAFFQEDAFQQRVFVTQHEAFIGGMAMSSLEVG